MAVSKSLRYQVLQRDNYTCRYCGAYAPFVKLVVDHAMPRKLGGQDVAENLITSCEPCNLGKSASLPPSFLLGEIAEAERLWSARAADPPSDDDLAEMRAYQDAYYYLEQLSVGDALSAITRVYAAAFPYRPELAEVIRAAAAIARDRQRGNV